MVSHTLGIPHPTGSPLYVLTSGLFMQLGGGSYFLLTLFSGLCVASGVAVFMGLRRLAPGAPGWKALGATGLVLAIAPSLWHQATINEVYALQILLFALFLWLYLQPPTRPLTLLLAYVAALAFGNHQSAIFLLPFVVERLWAARRLRGTVPLALGLALLGATIYLYLPVRSAGHPLMDWGGTASLPAFWRHITGWQYSNWVGVESLDSLSEGLTFLGQRLWVNFPWLLLPLALVGARQLWQHRRRLAVTTLLSGALCTLFGLSFPNPDIDAFYLLLYLVVALWLACGLVWLAGRGKIGTILAPVIVLASLAPVWVRNFDALDRRGFRVPTDLVRDAMQTAPQGAVVLTREWDHYSPWLYLRFVEGFRPDVLWIDTELLRRSWYPAFLRQAAPERFARAQAALERLAPQIARFEAGQPYNPRDIEGAYADAIYALSLGQPGPVLVDGIGNGPADWGIERRYLRGAQEVPWGLLYRAVRPDEPVPALPSWPVMRNASVSPGGSPRTVFNLGLYRRMRNARTAYTSPVP